MHWIDFNKFPPVERQKKNIKKKHLGVFISSLCRVLYTASQNITETTLELSFKKNYLSRS